jgi:hypothetical protein
MSNILNEVYITLNDFLIANNMPCQIRGFDNFYTRIISSDLSNVITKNLDHNTLQYDPWFFQRPTLFLHDQEPMMFAVQKNQWKKLQFNYSAFDSRMIILTSEINSKELDDFCATTGAIPCYWFSNGALALEWYHYGRWNLNNDLSPKSTKLRYKFSSMNRLIDQQRKYRPIASKLIANTVDNRYLRLSCNMTDPISSKNILEMDIPTKYQNLFKSMDLQNPLLINVMQDDLSETGDIMNKSFSLSYNYFSRVFCHIVTETMFIDDTLHLTEKSLRPFALQRPFIILGPKGSLDLLRRYGFKTFGDYWSEDYDTIADPWERLDAVIDIVRQLDKMTLSDMEEMLNNMKEILQYNFKHFYDGFKDVIYQELVHNLRQSIDHLKLKYEPGWIIQRIDSLPEEKIHNILDGPIMDEIPDQHLYEGIQVGDYTMIDHNIRRLIVHHIGLDKKASKENILASVKSMMM